MPELGPRQRAAITKRNNTRDAFLGTAIALFSESDYPDIRIEDIVRLSSRGLATFYNTFPRAKSSWATAVLDARLNEALDQPTALESQVGRTPRALLLGHFGLLDAASAPLPGVTLALVEERTEGAPYIELLPRYYGEVAQALRDGQEQQVFRGDIDATEMADYALDSLASVYAVHLDRSTERATNAASMLLDGLVVR